MSEVALSGGCQCGAVRFHVEEIGRASICHCRMCQKAFGGFYGALVTAKKFEWTRGEPSWFRSSNQIERGYCKGCGTPLAYQHEGGTELAIGAFDQPKLLPPELQINMAERVGFVDTIAGLPAHDGGASEQAGAFFAGVVTYQHPDHDTQEWPVSRK